MSYIRLDENVIIHEKESKIQKKEFKIRENIYAPPTHTNVWVYM